MRFRRRFVAHSAVWILIAVVAGLIYAGRVILAARASTLIPEPATLAPDDPRSLSAAEKVLGEAFAEMQNTRDQIAAEASAKPGLATSSTTCEWPSGSTPSRGSIANAIMFDSFSPLQYARHPALNAEDKPLCESEIWELEAILKSIRRSIDPIIHEATLVGMSERVELIDNGRIEAWVPKPEDISVDLGARALVSARASRGITISREEALDIVSKDPARFCASPNSSCIKHKGRYYLSASFPRLPRYEAAHEMARMAGVEALAIVTAWFASRGYSQTQEELVKATQEFFEMAPP